MFSSPFSLLLCASFCFVSARSASGEREKAGRVFFIVFHCLVERKKKKNKKPDDDATPSQNTFSFPLGINNDNNKPHFCLFGTVFFRFICRAFREDLICATLCAERKGKTSRSERESHASMIRASERFFRCHRHPSPFLSLLSTNPDTALIRPRPRRTKNNKSQEEAQKQQHHGAQCRALPPPRGLCGARRCSLLVRRAMLSRQTFDVGANHPQSSQEE